VLRIAIFQYDIAWENREANLNKVQSLLENCPPEADLFVLPEMFTTGFSMNAPRLAEPVTGNTMNRVKQWAARFNLAIAGSFIACENNCFYNRGFFITPQGETFFYDKRHLFSISKENMFFSAGEKKVIVPYKGWNICLQICYDLRFPVWARNIGNEYDLLLYTANWPASRIAAWNVLLPARAVENLAYVCGVNRVGESIDEEGICLKYNGSSSVHDMKGTLLAGFEPDEEGVKTVALSLEALKNFREKFPVWKDADAVLIR